MAKNMNTALKLGIISVVALCTALAVQPDVGRAEVLGTYRLTPAGGARVNWTELPIAITNNPRSSTDPEFYVDWTVGRQHIGQILFISAATHEDFDILAGVLTNGQADYMEFHFGRSGFGGTDCARFTKTPGVVEEACDFAGHTVTAMSLTIHALTLNVNPSVPWTDYWCDVTFAIHGKYGGGNGTQEYPYQIWDANDMQALMLMTGTSALC